MTLKYKDEFDIGIFSAVFETIQNRTPVDSVKIVINIATT